jgi:hypothetical protein
MDRASISVEREEYFLVVIRTTRTGTKRAPENDHRWIEAQWQRQKQIESNGP